ncbi:hypothetical protein ACQI4E_23570 [Streptomyces sp. CA-252508]|uniref:hypothetical protein n=1 Tax=Streptomyces sp. CA-252508 TaxID=3418946 RepID=UPI003D92C6EA
MERVIDLDEVVAAVAARRPAWQAAGLAVGPVTWRDEAATWPQRLEIDRSRVSDPDSMGIQLRNSHEAELHVVLYRGGWADVDYIASIDDAGVIPAPAMTSAQAFGALPDTCVARVFGPHVTIE